MFETLKPFEAPRKLLALAMAFTTILEPMPVDLLNEPGRPSNTWL
jgi:hypothetical protein